MHFKTSGFNMPNKRMNEDDMRMADEQAQIEHENALEAQIKRKREQRRQQANIDVAKLAGMYASDVSDAPTPPYSTVGVANGPDVQDAMLYERGQAYGDAWIFTSDVLEFILIRKPEAVETLVKDSKYLYAWITILCKLLRAIQSPHIADHWRDIAGYATLVAEHIETGSRSR